MCKKFATKYTYLGKTLSLYKWSTVLGIPYGTLARKIKLGQSLDEIYKYRVKSDMLERQHIADLV
jgi:hypothetical protein